jgi:hypothetical protein
MHNLFVYWNLPVFWLCSRTCLFHMMPRDLVHGETESLGILYGTTLIRDTKAIDAFQLESHTFRSALYSSAPTSLVTVGIQEP